MPPKYGAAPVSSTSSSSSDDEVAPPPNPKPKPIAAAAAAPSSSSYENESSSSEEAEEVAPPPNPNPKPTAAAAPPSSPSDESSGGEEEEEEEVAPAPPPPNPKPTAAAKAASCSDEEESGSSADENDDAPPASKPATPAATPAAKPIPVPSATPSATKSRAFQRTWSDKDEIALLQGVLLYNASNGVIVSTNSDMKEFHQFIRSSLQIEVRPSQLFDRVRRFKAKYQKTRDKGEPPSFDKPHDATIYELSRKIWGAERVKPENGNAKESRAAKRRKRHEISNGAEEKNGDTAVAQVQVRYPYLAEAVSRMGASIQSGFLLNKVIGLVDDSEAMALEKRHKKMVMMQVDLTNDTAALIKKATQNMC